MQYLNPRFYDRQIARETTRAQRTADSTQTAQIVVSLDEEPDQRVLLHTDAQYAKTDEFQAFCGQVHAELFPQRVEVAP